MVHTYTMSIYISRGLRRCSSLDYMGDARASKCGTNDENRTPTLFLYICVS